MRSSIRRTTSAVASASASEPSLLQHANASAANASAAAASYAGRVRPARTLCGVAHAASASTHVVAAVARGAVEKVPMLHTVRDAGVAQ